MPPDQLRTTSIENLPERSATEPGPSRSVQVEFLHFVAQGIASDSEHHCGAGLIAAGFFERFPEQVLLGLPQTEIRGWIAWMSGQ